MKLIFPLVFVSLIAFHNVHLAGPKLNGTSCTYLTPLNFRGYLCLDIKQNQVETRRVLFMIEHIASRQGRVLVSAGFIQINPNLLNRLFYKNNLLIVNYIGNFPGALANSILEKKGLPSIAFSANSDKCAFISNECHSYGIPVISLIDFGMSFVYKKTNSIDYQLIGNDDSEGGAMFFILLLTFVLSRHF